MKFNEEVLSSHPGWAPSLEIIQTLQKQGHQAVLAGGCVRDGFLQRPPNDLDIATSAEPQEVEKLFAKTVAVGKAFGVIRVLLKGADIEVASFRFDGAYEDGRRPTSVKWASAEEDAKRRDFTINALFYDPVCKQVQDFVNGIEDIDKKIIRCVGTAELRFQEDHLRLLRAVRFAAELGFEVEQTTWHAILSNASLVQKVSRERIRDEMFKLLKATHAKQGFELLFTSGLLLSIDSTLSAGWSQKDQFLWPRRIQDEFSIWTYYFTWTDFTHLTSRLALYKLSKPIQRYVQQVIKYYESESDISQWSLGQKLAEYEHSEFKLALEIINQKKGQRNWLENLNSEMQKRNLIAGYPLRLLKGEDIPENVPLSERGIWLDKAYQLQLELNLQDKTVLLQKLMLKKSQEGNKN